MVLPCNAVEVQQADVSLTNRCSVHGATCDGEPCDCLVSVAGMLRQVEELAHIQVEKEFLNGLYGVTHVNYTQWGYRRKRGIYIPKSLHVCSRGVY